MPFASDRDPNACEANRDCDREGADMYGPEQFSIEEAIEDHAVPYDQPRDQRQPVGAV
jgi:hypothetical protein